MEFKMRIDCDNAAFEDYPDELSRILEQTAQRIRDGITDKYENVWDINGNIVGTFRLAEQEDERRLI